MNKVSKDDVLQATDGGKTVILDYYPQAQAGFDRRRNFKLRADDRNPSATVFFRDGIWFLQDKGGSDNKAKTALSIVMEEERLTFPQACEFIAAKYAPHLLAGPSTVVVKPAPERAEAAPQETMTVQKRKTGKFTKKELEILGHQITQEVCNELKLVPLDSYITRKNEKGKSWKISSTEDYPIFYYDYGTWGRLYQPLGDLRFMFVGEKPADFIFGDSWFLKAFDNSKRRTPDVSEAEEEDHEAQDQDDSDDPDDEDNFGSEAGNSSRLEQCDAIIICSGGSDALNVRNACLMTGRAGWHVAWLNSETADLSRVDMFHLRQIAKEIYILYDQDSTGIAHAYRLAMKYLDIRIILLPDDLKRFKTKKGGACKDAKDLFLHYRKPSAQDPYKIFSNLLRVSGSLRFWIRFTDRRGKECFDINNEQLYSFLQASGYYRIESSATSKGFTFCYIKDNIVRLIDEQAIASECNAELIQYLYGHPEYYSQALANAIHRSNQVKLGSLEKLRIIAPNFRYFGAHFDHVLFKNKIIRIDREGLSEIKPKDWPYFEYSNKILDHEIRLDDTPPFDIVETPAALALRKEIEGLDPRSPMYKQKQAELDTLTGTARFELRINRPDFSFLQYIYNTGRVHWRKEELGQELTEEEKAEQDLHFMSKVMALGYLLTKYKSAAEAKAVYAMETEVSDEGQHKGGTGKSLFLGSVEQMRNQLFINGQELRPDKMEFLFQGVVKGVTDTIYFDDVNKSIDLHRFMPAITNKITINAKYAAAVTLEYAESPKISFSSNHAIREFDNSLRRRIWFTAFSDYYHSADPSAKLTLRNPATEFGKNLIQDYTEAEKNEFYNFMLTCMHVYIKHQVAIQPPMHDIEQRNIQRQIGDDFIYWAEEYFAVDIHRDAYINKSEAFEEYKMSLPKRAQDSVKMQTFKSRLIQFCEYKGWEFNPEEFLQTESDRKRNEIHRKEGGADIYLFYIRTTEEEDEEPIF